MLRTMYLYGYGCIQMDTPPLSLHLYVSVKMDGCIDAYSQTCMRARPGVSLSLADCVVFVVHTGLFT